MPEFKGRSRAIVQAPSSVLSQPAVPVVDPLSPTVQQHIADMRATLAAEPHGLGLAAPQVGLDVRIIVLKPGQFGAGVLINPVIVSKKNPKLGTERCLSVKEGKLGVDVVRPRNIRVVYTDQRGKVQKRAATNLQAVLIQHEIDHLDGKILLDYLD